MNDSERSIGERDLALYGTVLGVIALVAIILAIVS
jgi:hypothetical protein